jgi:methionine synthase II (cobalamin-independent)
VPPTPFIQLLDVAHRRNTTLDIRIGSGSILILRKRENAAPISPIVALYIEALNEVVRDRPAGMTIMVHMCRGNVGEEIATAGYDPIAERAFATLDVDGFLLEYDKPRAGDFAPLRSRRTSSLRSA